MNNLQEISLQNQQDFWSVLYMNLGESIMKICGRHGEYVIRKALGTIAETEGEMYREVCLAQGKKTNMHTLYAMGCGCSQDPRMNTAVRTDNEQVRLWEVYTCPMATLWLDHGAAYVANMYCEENQPGLIKAFTGGKGQFHVSKKLTCHRTNGCRPDNYCRFAAYYRPANVPDEKQREESFTDGEPAAEEIAKPESARDMLTRRSILLLKELTKEAEAVFGTEGLNAVALGLRATVAPAEAMIRHYAEMTLNTDLAAFAKNNLPLDLGEDQETQWEKYGSKEAKKLFVRSFAGPLKASLGI